MDNDIAPDFIVIDDDPINNMICNKVISKAIPDAAVQTFTSPEKGLEYILATYCGNDARSGILLLDINMPGLSGWEVLDKLELSAAVVKRQVKIFMLSSSVDQQDKEKAANNALLSGYIIKPLSQAKLQAVYPGDTAIVLGVAPGGA